MTFVPGNAAGLLAEFGSPLYVYDASLIEQALHRFRQAFPYDPLECYFAIVCNKNHFIARLLSTLGVGVHANTPGDAFAALRAGVPRDAIRYSGTNLSGSDFDWLADHGIHHLNLDSLDQLRDWTARRPQAGIGLRLLVDDEQSTNRIGVTPAELAPALEMCRQSGARLTGLHMYAGTNTLRAGRFLDCLDRLIACSAMLPDLEYIDLGGGFGVAYDARREPLALTELGRAVASRMERLSSTRGRRIALLIEPGRILVAEAGSLLMTVISVKERGGRRYVGVDTTVGNVVVESVYHAFHRVVPIAPRGAVLPIATDVCGNTTHSRDVVARACQLPDVQPGDVLVLGDVGAYGYAMSSHFLNRPRPAEVVLHNGVVNLTTRRETFDDLVATQLMS